MYAYVGKERARGPSHTIARKTRYNDSVQEEAPELLDILEAAARERHALDGHCAELRRKNAELQEALQAFRSMSHQLPAEGPAAAYKTQEREHGARQRSTEEHDVQSFLNSVETAGGAQWRSSEGLVHVLGPPRRCSMAQAVEAAPQAAAVRAEAASCISSQRRGSGTSAVGVDEVAQRRSALAAKIAQERAELQMHSQVGGADAAAAAPAIPSLNAEPIRFDHEAHLRRASLRSSLGAGTRSNRSSFAFRLPLVEEWCEEASAGSTARRGSGMASAPGSSMLAAATLEADMVVQEAQSPAYVQGQRAPAEGERASTKSRRWSNSNASMPGQVWQEGSKAREDEPRDPIGPIVRSDACGGTDSSQGVQDTQRWQPASQGGETAAFRGTATHAQSHESTACHVGSIGSDEAWPDDAAAGAGAAQEAFGQDSYAPPVAWQQERRRSSLHFRPAPSSHGTSVYSPVPAPTPGDAFSRRWSNAAEGPPSTPPSAGRHLGSSAAASTTISEAAMTENQHNDTKAVTGAVGQAAATKRAVCCACCTCCHGKSRNKSGSSRSTAGSQASVRSGATSVSAESSCRTPTNQRPSTAAESPRTSGPGDAAPLHAALGRYTTLYNRERAANGLTPQTSLLWAAPLSTPEPAAKDARREQERATGSAWPVATPPGTAEQPPWAFPAGGVCPISQREDCYSERNNEAEERPASAADDEASETTHKGAPIDSCPERHEIGRVYHSLEERARLLRVPPPTLLGCPAPWMEAPNAPPYAFSDPSDLLGRLELAPSVRRLQKQHRQMAFAAAADVPASHTFLLAAPWASAAETARGALSTAGAVGAPDNEPWASVGEFFAAGWRDKSKQKEDRLSEG